jgi:hypothetical protein
MQRANERSLTVTALVRLLEIRGRHSDAEADLSSALASLDVPDPIVGYSAGR